MQGVIRKVGSTIKPSLFAPRILQSQIDKVVFNFTSPQIKKRIWLHGKFGCSPVFCIVHWNAPAFLMLNIDQLELLYPNSKIYVLDNGSQHANTEAVKKGLKRFNNVTLFVAPNWAKGIGANYLLFSHTKGLQFLLNYAAEQRDEIAVFLDQDCLLSNNIDDLFAKLGTNVILIGKRYGRANNLIHASFMILQPKRINQLFGEFSFFHDRRNFANNTRRQFFEPYHGLSLKAKGKLLFLEQNDEIPGISSYIFQGKTYAWHPWASSATVGYSAKDRLNGVPVTLRQKGTKLAFEYMKQIHEKTTTDA